MRKLQRADINLEQGVLQVRNKGAKNHYRVRTIPLDEEAMYAAERLLEIADEKGSRVPMHYIFPFRRGYLEYHPDRPMTEFGLWKRFDEVRKAANVPWLRIHDLRHSAITRMAEAGVPIAVIMSMAGHISQRMTQHYTAVSQSAKRTALQTTYGARGKVENSPPASVPIANPQALEASSVLAKTRRSTAVRGPNTMVMALSVPVGADIEVDGVFVGNTPSELAVDPGAHTFKITKKGFKPFERAISIAAGSRPTITAELEKAGISA
jgi:hypothetical protein